MAAFAPIKIFFLRCMINLNIIAYHFARKLYLHALPSLNLFWKHVPKKAKFWEKVKEKEKGRQFFPMAFCFCFVFSLFVCLFLLLTLKTTIVLNQTPCFGTQPSLVAPPDTTLENG